MDFRKGKRTRDGICQLRILSDRLLDKKKKLYICFIYYAKAFDKVNHNKLIDVLRKYEIPSEEIRIISSIYWNQVAYVRTNKGMSKQISIKKGVRQGCILSPVLFNLYSEELINEALEDEEGVKLNGIGITNIRYADDTILIADSEDKLQTMLNKVVDACSNFGMELNVKKTR